ncbi:MULTISPECIES: archease [unclassified Streptomyces]|uniref:archease n=1 Tax=unclassified Streptomyces TaxID=2593676 RepID=UPI000AC43D33|nr:MULTISPECIES: archease [unclassified Streptomyces]AZM58571.1 protein archease [Streptomyces sp. WAC 01438]RSM88264.1 protein archease [Streptomyces sp. WAC 01420]
MVGDTGDYGQARRPDESGHRAVARDDEVRIEAWAASREHCLAEAVSAMVESFADVSGVRPTGVGRIRLGAASDDDLLAALLDEILYRLDVYGQVPVDVEADEAEGGLDVRLAVAGLSQVRLTGATPAAVTWEDLHVTPGPCGWSCAITMDA